MTKNPKQHTKDVHVALVFKDFAAWLKSSCVGLNVAGYATADVLTKNGFDVSVFPVRHNVDLVNFIDKYHETHDHRLTHVIISAPWLSLHDLKAILKHFSDIHFLILSHSNVGFLQADPWGVELFRLYIELSREYKNLSVGGNSAKFVKWLSKAYDYKAVLLPNLYPISDSVKPKPIWDGKSTIKIGLFGAPRAEKNFMTAAAGALLIQKETGAKIELHMNSGGEEVNRVMMAIEQMFNGCPDATLIKHPWAYWDDFIKIIADMDLMLQPSYTESFNMVTADGISVGVPSVVSSAIYWAPDAWKADVDDANQIEEIGLKLLESHSQRLEGIKALKKHNVDSVNHWREYLK